MQIYRLHFKVLIIREKIYKKVLVIWTMLVLFCEQSCCAGSYSYVTYTIFRFSFMLNFQLCVTANPQRRHVQHKLLVAPSTPNKMFDILLMLQMSMSVKNRSLMTVNIHVEIQKEATSANVGKVTRGMVGKRDQDAL